MQLREFFGLPRKETRNFPDVGTFPSIGTLERPSGDLLDVFQTFPTPSAGVTVTPQKVLGIPAAYSAIRVLSEDLASLPFHLYAIQDKRKERVYDDPRAQLIDEEPNAEMTAFELWEMVTGHLNLYGNAYLYREFSPVTGLTTGLWPLRPDKTRPFRRENGEKWYATQLDSGEQRVIEPLSIVHIRAFATGGDVGMSPVSLARQAFSTSLAQDEYAGRFFSNDARPGGVIQFGGDANKETVQKVLNQWKEAHQGLERKHLVGVLTNGATWNDIGFNAQDSQFLQSREFSVMEMARIFKIPPYKIASFDKSATYASIEMNSIEYVRGSLEPWCDRIEQQIKRTLFASQMDRRRGLKPEFKLDGLLRGDIKTRYEAHAIAITAGWKSRNEVREDEGYAPVEGLDDFGALSPQPNDLTAPEPMLNGNARAFLVTNSD